MMSTAPELRTVPRLRRYASSTDPANPEVTHDEREQPSKSRIIMAICARFAASATRVKSFRKASVEGVGGGGGGAMLGDGCVDDMADAWRCR